MVFPFLAPTNTKSTMLLDGVTTNVALTPSVTLLSPAGISCFICARAICEQKNRPASAIMAVLFIFLFIFSSFILHYVEYIGQKKLRGVTVDAPKTRNHGNANLLILIHAQHSGLYRNA